MALSMPFRTALPRDFRVAGFCIVAADGIQLVAWASGVFQEESAAVSEVDFRGLQGHAGMRANYLVNCFAEMDESALPIWTTAWTVPRELSLD